MTTYKVTCLDAKYDDEMGMLVMNCRFEHTKEKKIIVFSKNDLPKLFRMKQMADKDLHRFAELMRKRGRPFNLSIDDDPKRKQMTPEEQLQYASMFSKRISEELDKVCEGLSEDRGQMQRKLGRMAEEGKINAIDLLKEEQVVRGKLGR